MSMQSWPQRGLPEPAGAVFRVEFSKETREQLRNLALQRGMMVFGLVAWSLAVVWLVLTRRVDVLMGVAIYLPLVIAGVVRVRQLSRMPVEAAALTVSSRGIEVWSPKGIHLVLPWDVVASVRAGQLGVGLTLAPGVGPATPGVTGLRTPSGLALVRALADPTDSPLFFDAITYDREGLVGALHRLAPEGVRIDS